MDLIGVDIGGTKVSVCLGDETGNIVAHKRAVTASLGPPEQGLQKILEMIGHLLRDENKEVHEIAAIGLAVPGPMSVREGKIIKPPNLPGWEDVPIVQFFRERLDRPVFINNDADAGALAEWEFGAAKHVDHLVFLTASTGMGGGVITHGKLVQGQTDTAGEVGHFVLDPKGPKCPCGQNGCFEIYCGGRNVALAVQRTIREKKIKTAILDEAEGKIEKIDMKCLLQAVKKGDSYALEVWEGFLERLAQGVGILLMTLNPDALILGTIAAHSQEFVMKPLLKALPRFAWKDPLAHCRVEASQLGDKIGKLGALALAINGLRHVPAES